MALLMRWRGIKSQNQLARISGVAQSSINRIFTQGDQFAPQRTTLLRLARALHTTPHWLTDGIETRRTSGTPGTPADHAAAFPWLNSATHDQATGTLVEIHSLVEQLTDPERRTLLSLIRLLASPRPKKPNNPKPPPKPKSSNNEPEGGKHEAEGK